MLSNELLGWDVHLKFNRTCVDCQQYFDVDGNKDTAHYSHKKWIL